MAVTVQSVAAGSPAEACGIVPEDILVSINGHDIQDVLDYQFYCTEMDLTVSLLRAEKPLALRLQKGEYEDLGLSFATYLMDEKRRCKNKCIFCFIDQLPKGMRKSLYFKDDDARLSFLFGNYITLTNLTPREISRIKEMHVSPVNISVHTTDPALRVRMMGNPHAGEVLSVLQDFASHGIKLNTQLVLCRGINDAAHLERSLTELAALFPAIQSIAVVPVGLTAHREALFPLIPYDAKSAAEVLKVVDTFGEAFYREHGTRLAFAADEFYLKAGLPLPDEAHYEDYPQLENGVGMLTLLEAEFREALAQRDAQTPISSRSITMATGKAAYPFLVKLVDELTKKWHNLKVQLIAIQNHFFGPEIDVAGLLTGQDFYTQLSRLDLGDELLLPAAALRYEGDCFLDDMTLVTLSEKLGVPITVVPNDGEQLLTSMLGKE